MQPLTLDNSILVALCRFFPIPGILASKLKLLDITATYSLLKQRKARRESSAVRRMVREDVRALDLMGEMAKQKR